jgi:hypothetical protein
MNQQHTETETDNELRVALDHFIENVFPDLFRGATTTNPDYKRVYAIVSERKKEKAGKPNRLTDSWIMSTLSKFGGTVKGQPRYQFDQMIVVTILPG